MPRWTVDQLSAYAKRQLAASANTRRQIRERVMKIVGRAPVQDCMDPIVPNARGKTVAMKISSPGNRHNPKVVLAFFQHHGLPAPVPEYRFDPERRWRFDLAWCSGLQPPRLALEIQGGIWTHGRHVRPAALLQEYEKLNRAAVLGWRVLFVTPDQLLTRQTADLIRAALAI